MKNIKNRTTICLYLDEDLKKYLEKKAKERCLTLNAYIRLILIERSK